MAWRSRIRGVSKKKEKSILRGLRDDGVVSAEAEEAQGGAGGAHGVEPVMFETEGEIVGQRIYLPNVQIRLMRNNTPVGQAYDPTIATFRIPPSMTKTDLRSYLSSVYGLEVTFIRTDLYLPPVQRVVGGKQVRQSGSTKNYKRAVVGLVEPFHYPDDVEELRAQGVAAGVGDKWAEEREGWLNEKFQKDRMDENMKRARFKLYKGYRWRSRWHDNEVSHQISRFEISRATASRAQSAECEVTRWESSVWCALPSASHRVPSRRVASHSSPDSTLSMSKAGLEADLTRETLSEISWPSGPNESLRSSQRLSDYVKPEELKSRRQHEYQYEYEYEGRRICITYLYLFYTSVFSCRLAFAQIC